MVIDSRFPWKLPRVGREFSPYPYRMSVAEWKALLAKAKQGDSEAEWGVAGRFEDGCKDKKGKFSSGAQPGELRTGFGELQSTVVHRLNAAWESSWGTRSTQAEIGVKHWNG